jgi:hypothetical protein
MSAPERCKGCKNANGCAWTKYRDATEEESHPGGGRTVYKVAIPGPDCPFVLLAKKDAEIERLRNALQRIVDVDENWQIEEYGGIQREALETTIARAALKEVK